jgi:hypothetical protein
VKSLSICILNKNRVFFTGKKVGDQIIDLPIRCMSKLNYLCGEILSIHPGEHGTLYIVLNNNKSFLPGWNLIPIWISECGQSGIVAMWLDNKVAEIIRFTSIVIEVEGINQIGAGI